MAWCYSTCCGFLHVYCFSGNIVHCAVAFFFMLQCCASCCSIFLCAASFFFLPLQLLCSQSKKEDNSVHGSSEVMLAIAASCTGSVTSCGDGFILLPQGPLTKQKTINLCGVWHQPECWWRVNIVCHITIFVSLTL